VDTFLAVTEIDAANVEAGLEKARDQLRKFSFKEIRDEAVRKGAAEASERWKALLAGTIDQDLEALRRTPYAWRRLVGEIAIARGTHGFELFLCPISRTKAAVSVAFFESLHEAVYSFKPSYEKEIDVEVKEDFASLFVVLTRSFSAGAFALRRMEEMTDLVEPVTEAEIRDWLVSPTPELVSRLRIMLAGVRLGTVGRPQIEKAWASGKVIDNVHDFLIFDRLQ